MEKSKSKWKRVKMGEEGCDWCVFFVVLSRFRGEIGRGAGLRVALGVWQRWVVVSKIYNTRFHEEIGWASGHRIVSRSAGSRRLLNSRRNRSRQKGFVGVRIALSSPEWASSERDSKGGLYAVVLVKVCLMTKLSIKEASAPRTATASIPGTPPITTLTSLVILTFVQSLSRHRSHAWSGD